MGSLTLPPAGAVYLDTDAIIYSVEKIDPYATLLQPLWLAAQAGQFIVMSSDLALLETLVKPLPDTANTLNRVRGRRVTCFNRLTLPGIEFIR